MAGATYVKSARTVCGKRPREVYGVCLRECRLLVHVFLHSHVATGSGYSRLPVGGSMLLDEVLLGHNLRIIIQRQVKRSLPTMSSRYPQHTNNG